MGAGAGVLPRILVFGEAGQVARELRRELSTLGELVVVGRATPGLSADFEHPDELAEVVAQVAPQVIVNAAAYTAVDNAEREEAMAFRVNAEAPARLAAAAAACGALMVHYSTDYVFDGEGERPYREDDPTGPRSAYGRSKLAGEEALRASGCAHLVFRTSWVYGVHGHNFMRTIRRLAREREVLRIVADQRGAPTWSRHIAQATAQVLARMLANPGRWEACSGVYHLTSGGHTSWFEFAQRIVAHQRQREPVMTTRIEPIATHEYPLPAARPAWSVLDGTRLFETFGVRLPAWHEALAQVQQDLDAI